MAGEKNRPAIDTLGRSLAGLRKICDERLFPAYRLNVPFSGIATGYVPAYLVGIDGLVQLRPDEAGAECSANDLRVTLLGRAHDLITALGGGGWVLAEAPRLEFGGDLIRPVVSPGGDVHRPPRELGIRLSVNLEVFRTKGTAC